MSWKCSFCDSYNEDDLIQCFVCGATRSEKSFKEGMRRAREERAMRLKEKIFKKSYSISNWTFILGVTVSFIALAVMIIIKIVNGRLDDVWNSVAVAAGRIGNNLSVTFSENLPLLIKRIISGHSSNLSENVKKLWDVIAENLAVFSQMAFEIIPATSEKNINISYNNMIIPMARNVSLNIGMLTAVVAGLFSSAETAIKYLINVANGIINSIGKHFI